nr:glycosyltransferase [Aquicoccus sp. G2-2]MEA1112581.1 glycosyltransferase [Aquicoccus sp. G2-2]
MSVIIPAANEEALIGRCLAAVLASEPKPGAGSGSIPLPRPMQVIVVVNGCTDATAQVARGHAGAFSRMGWDFEVLELGAVGKTGALNAGDDVAKFDDRVYLDADVVVSKPLLDQIGRALARKRAVYASGRVRFAKPRRMITKLYAKTYERVPFMAQGVPGCGFFAVNAAGRRRWRRWPDIISDDTFARLCFAPAERIGVSASYEWPIVEGWDNLVRVRARQDAGVREVHKAFPQLAANDDNPKVGFFGKGLLFMRNPLSFLTYAAVRIAARMTGGERNWSRGR